MKTYEEIELDIEKEILKFETKKIIVRRLLENINNTKIDGYNVVFHKENYDK